MLKLKNICKYYKVGKEKKIILDNITLDFKRGELVFILGASGSGKSTLLNIISGNLKSDSGEIWLDSNCISNFKEKELNNYRSSVIGNIFQDYNLIEYMSVIDNVMIGYSNGISKDDINILLKQLGIYKKRKMVVNKLSGGEKQRVAIARALVNNPDIILADEPTGALDSKNGIEVMEILKKISLTKLVIVVSHDNYLANKYASRIINIKDGRCEYYPITIDNQIICNYKKNKMKLKSIIKLAIKNLCLKKIRTVFTSLAISLGIVTMFIVTNMYSNFNNEIVNLEKDIVSVFPVSINNGNYEILDNEVDKSDDKIIIKDRKKWIHTNSINGKYIDYLNNIDVIKYKNYIYDISLPIISDEYNVINNSYFYSVPNSGYIDDNYNILAGRNIMNKYEVLLKVDSNNNVDSELLNYFDIDKDINYDDIIGRKIRIILNDEYYVNKDEYYVINNNNYELYNESKIELEIVGIVKEKNEINNNNYLYYDISLLDLIFDENKNSEIVNRQLNSDYNILGLNVNINDMLSYLGYNSLPIGIDLYVDSLENKDILLNKLDKYNEENEEIVYIDTMSNTIDIVKKFILIISIILIIFSLIAIIISSLMIGILTNVRVLERKKEIGILRSLGVSKRNIKKLFNIENFLIGILSLVISLIVIYLIKRPINSIIDSYLGIDDIFIIKYKIIFVVFIINMIIIKISGSIPAKKASKMEIVSCIYNR